MNLKPDFDMNTVPNVSKLRIWATQKIGHLLSKICVTSRLSRLSQRVIAKHNVIFRGIKKREDDGLFTSFPWKNLAEALFDSRCRIIGWPHSVRLPGNTELSKPSFSGLEKAEVLAFANALLKQSLRVEAWPTG